MVRGTVLVILLFALWGMSSVYAQQSRNCAQDCRTQQKSVLEKLSCCYMQHGVWDLREGVPAKVTSRTGTRSVVLFCVSQLAAS